MKRFAAALAGIGLLALVCSIYLGLCRPGYGPLILMSTGLMLQGLYLIHLGWNAAGLRRNLERRLEGYAYLSGGYARPEKHAILLGTLKKVEQKAASLAAVVVFLAIAVVTVGASDMKTPRISAWYYALLMPLVPVFIALVVGFKQVDGHDLPDSAEQGSWANDATLLHDALKRDLLNKEIAFRFAWRTTQAYSIVVGLGLLSWAVIDR